MGGVPEEYGGYPASATGADFFSLAGSSGITVNLMARSGVMGAAETGQDTGKFSLDVSGKCASAGPHAGCIRHYLLQSPTSPTGLWRLLGDILVTNS